MIGNLIFKSIPGLVAVRNRVDARLKDVRDSPAFQIYPNLHFEYEAPTQERELKYRLEGVECVDSGFMDTLQSAFTKKLKWKITGMDKFVFITLDSTTLQPIPSVQVLAWKYALDMIVILLTMACILFVIWCIRPVVLEYLKPHAIHHYIWSIVSFLIRISQLQPRHHDPPMKLVAAGR
jgi:hypothetical protein